MVSIRSPQKLPGENGLHTRDGSLTKRKQEQWERERAEGEQTSGWFNKFGQKHTPGRRRAVNWAINEGAEAAEAEQAAADADNDKRRNESDGATTSSDQQLLIDNNNGTIHHQMQQWKSIEPSPMAHAPSPLAHHRPPSSIPPAAMLYSAPTGGFSVPTPMHFFTTPPPPLFGDYHHQAQCQRQFLPGAMPMFPQFVPPPPLPPVGVIDTAAFILAAHQQQKFPLGMPQHPLMPTPPFSCPSSLEEAGNNSPAVEQHQQYHQHQLQLNETVPSTVLSSSPACIEADNNKATPPTAPKRGEAEPANFMRAPRRSLSMDASGTWEEELARQVAERQMSADREAQRALEEERVREREERECRAREEAEREAEERRRTDRIEARDQNERSTFASLQRAQREAELLRRAKLFRHILLDGDGQTDMDTARRLLKCADGEETVLNDVIRQLRDFDRQKRLANESCGNLSPSSTNGKITPKSAKDAGKAIGKTALFSRANSWNVKHSRTMPAAVFSPPIIAQSKLPPLSVAEHAKVRAEIVVTAPDIVHQKNVALPPKKTASANGQNTVSTTASPSSHNNSTVTSPNTSSKYGNGSQKPTPPDKQHKSLRQKVQNAVRSGAAMLRRKDSGGKTNGDGAKVLRTVGLSSDQQLLIDNNNGTIHHQMQQWKSIEPSPMAHAPSPLAHHRPPSSIPPAAMLYSAPTGGFSVPTPMHFFTTPPPPLFGDYHHQAQCQRQFLPGAMPMFPQFVPPPPLPPVGVIDTAAFILAAHQQQKFPLGMPQHPLMPTPPFSCPSSLEEAGNNSPAVEQHQQYHQHQLQLNETVPSTVLSSSPACIEADNNKATPPTAPKRGEAEPANFMRAPRRSLSMDASGTWEEELARQVAERQMSADREAQRALEEERVREREERECRAREEAEREAEERRRTDRIEARDQNERSTFASLQRAQREAELLRRAKLFRHILLDGDGQTDMDTARRLLKCADGEETVLNDVIRQLRDFDRQKRLANESCGNLSPSSTNGKITPKSAKDAGKAIGKTALFSRANSWNVKHSRTMPAAVFSPPIIAQSKLPPLSVAEHAKVRAEIVVTAPDIVHQKNVALPPKKTASANGQNTVSTTASPSSHNNSTVTSPNTSSKYGNGSQKPTPPDKQHKSLRQKVQNAVRSGAAMLRRKDSGGKTNGDGAKVLRTVGLFEQVTLRHRTSSNSNSNNQQQQQQQNRHPSSPSLSPSPTSAASTNSNTPPNQPAQQHPVEEQPLFSSPTFEFLLPPPLPVLADHRRRGRQLFELGSMTLSTMALPEAANDVKQMKLKHQQQQHVEEKKFDENGVEDDSEGKVAKCQNAQENGGGKAQQNSPPGSSATSSSSASVLRFRAALDSPFGSREDISNSLIVSNGYAAIPPAPPKFVGGPLRYANGGVSVAAAHQIVPPSPFRRPAQNGGGGGGGGGDSSEPLLRRSLRSPTMRRLQESLQSLAEDAPMSPTVSARGDVSRADTPKPFNCRTSQYRSLNLKRDTERQKQILEHLAQVRIQLKNSQVQIEQTISKQNLTTEGH